MNKILDTTIKKISVVIGTRPEAIKMGLLVSKLKADPRFDCKLIISAQHRELLDEVLSLFQITADFDLNLMGKYSDLHNMSAGAIEGIGEITKNFKSDALLVHGDTLTTFAASMVAFQQKIPLYHVEAGMRSGNLSAPWPEEGYRRMISQIATHHFAATSSNRLNLISENIPASQISVVGNTIVDALMHFTQKEFLDHHSRDFTKLGVPSENPYVLITCHRRENFGSGIRNICNAVGRLSLVYPEINFVFSVHPNPNVREPLISSFKDSSNVFLLDPLDYVTFLNLLKRSLFVMSDSGGIQEEAPSFGKFVLILRETTERKELMEINLGTIVGTDPDVIFSVANEQIELTNEIQSKFHNPFGDGRTTCRIIDQLYND